MDSYISATSTLPPFERPSTRPEAIRQATRVSFAKRSREDYNATAIEFSIEEFKDHVIKMVTATQFYQDAFGVREDELIEFAKASLGETDS
jgi:hypothetical protein